MVEDMAYHKLLRISAVLAAVVLLFDSGIIVPGTAEMSFNTQQYIAQVIGVTAAVQPTEINQITAALTEREQELNQREAALAEREINARAESSPISSSTDYSTYILSAILLIILVLIVLNYVLDFLRARQNRLAYASAN